MTLPPMGEASGFRLSWWVQLMAIATTCGLVMRSKITAPPGRRDCFVNSGCYLRRWATDQKMLRSSPEGLTHLTVMGWGTTDAEMVVLM